MKGDKAESAGENRVQSTPRPRASRGNRVESEPSVPLSYPVGLRFECQRCSRCCADTAERERRIVLLRAEVELIAAAKGMPAAAFALPNNSDEAYPFAMRKVDGRCVFLKGRECTVHRMRPLVCRFYPFKLKASENGGYEFITTLESCPGTGTSSPVRSAFSMGRDLPPGREPITLKKQDGHRELGAGTGDGKTGQV